MDEKGCRLTLHHHQVLAGKGANKCTTAHGSYRTYVTIEACAKLQMHPDVPKQTALRYAKQKIETFKQGFGSFGRLDYVTVAQQN